jgi:serine/threonine protein kinase
MADIFAMDGDAPETALNYRVLAEDEDGLASHDEDDSVVHELPLPISIKQTRRNSAATSQPSLLDIDVLLKSFVLAASPARQVMDPETRGPGCRYRPRLADFEPLKVLGRGLYGKVLLVRERATGVLFAQKQMSKLSLIVDEGGFGGKEQGAAKVTATYHRTLNERLILEMVNHRNIVKLYYAFQDHDKVYLILEYLSGGELFSHMSQLNYLNETHAAYYVAQMILALRYLHQNLNVVYRDLKPENCMLNAAGELVLTDFGLLKVSAPDDSHQSMIGTPQYMAPEVLKGDAYNYMVDWWLLGCVAFDMLTGSPPFTGNNNKKIMDKIVQSKRFLKFPYYLSLDAKEFLRKLLQANPEKRLDIDNDFDKVKQMRFFRHIDWDALEGNSDAEGPHPPILPLITDPVLAENFHDEFTEMSILPPPSGKHDILHVKGFSFTSDSYLERNGA